MSKPKQQGRKMDNLNMQTFASSSSNDSFPSPPVHKNKVNKGKRPNRDKYDVM